MQAELIIFYLLLIDSLGANAMTWLGGKWYTRHFRIFSRYFPPARGWSFLYLVLVIWIGFLLNRMGIL